MIIPYCIKERIPSIINNNEKEGFQLHTIHNGIRILYKLEKYTFTHGSSNFLFGKSTKSPKLLPPKNIMIDRFKIEYTIKNLKTDLILQVLTDTLKYKEWMIFLHSTELNCDLNRNSAIL